MLWGKLYANLCEHRKMRHVRRSHPTKRRDVAPLGLWALGIAWCKENYRTDGWIPEDELGRWDEDADELARRLVDAGLWHPEERDGEPGFQFHEWDQHQETAEQIEAKRDATRQRMANLRAGRRAQSVRAHRGSTAPEVRDIETETENNKTSSRRRDGQTHADKAGADFARFWDLYPHKVAKQEAAKAWMQVVRHTDVSTIATGLRNAIDVWTAEGRVSGGRVVGRDHYVPHPASWLRAGRWEDQQPGVVEVPTQPAQRPAAQALCDGATCPGTQHEWTRGRNRFVCAGHDA